MAELIANQGISFLVAPGGLSAVATSVTLYSAALFSSSGNFRITIDSEIMEVTAVVANVLTVVRGTEGTVAAAHIDGAPVYQIISAAGLTAYINQLIAGSGVVGSLTGVRHLSTDGSQGLGFGTTPNIALDTNFLADWRVVGNGYTPTNGPVQQGKRLGAGLSDVLYGYGSGGTVFAPTAVYQYSAGARSVIASTTSGNLQYGIFSTVLGAGYCGWADVGNGPFTLYVLGGLYECTGTFKAYLTDNSGAAYSDTYLAAAGTDVSHVLTGQGTYPGCRLVWTWDMTVNPGSGNITIQAVGLVL